MRITPQYISVGANRSSSCAACTSSGLLFFGAGKFIALWDSSSNRGVHATLQGHKGLVTTIKLLPGGRLVSGDSIGEIRIWNSVNGDDQWECMMSWEAHKGGSISAIGVLASSGNLDDMILTGGSDSLIKRWKLADKPEEVQEIDLKGKLPLDLEVGYMPGSKGMYESENR